MREKVNHTKPTPFFTQTLERINAMSPDEFKRFTIDEYPKWNRLVCEVANIDVHRGAQFPDITMLLYSEAPALYAAYETK